MTKKKTALDKILDLLNKPETTKYDPFPEENKKEGLYKDKKDRTVDVYLFNERWEWGYMSNCGMHMSNDMWWESEYIGPMTDNYGVVIVGLMNCAE